MDTGRLLQQLQRLPHHRKGKKSRSFNVENLVFFIKEGGGNPSSTLGTFFVVEDFGIIM